MEESDRLYRVNDLLTGLADEFEVASRFDGDEDYDNALNEATHAVAGILRIAPGRPDPDPFPVDTMVIIEDYEGTALGPFRVVRSYWPEPACELLLTGRTGGSYMGREHHRRLRLAPGPTDAHERAERVVWRVTAANADVHAGRALTDDELDRLANAIGHSSIPDALGDVISAVVSG